MNTIITLSSLVIAIALIGIRLFQAFKDGFSLSGFTDTLKRGGKQLFNEILMLIAVVVVFWIAYLILSELADGPRGCLWVPLAVWLWIICRGLFLPLGFAKNFQFLFGTIVFCVVGILVYLLFAWWIGMMLETSSIITCIVFGAMLIGAGYVLSVLSEGALLDLCGK